MPKKYSFVAALVYPLQHSAIVTVFIQLKQYPFICCSICSFIHSEIVRLLIQAVIFHPALQIVNILIIPNTIRDQI